ncbi:Protein of unknown function [Flavobacterium succinicans]|uniref:DUF3667 domain-containing protein n=1 Tax=Flavobacterium succinicans TaxID=29536 RepID=A0A1I5A4Y1_9FLAO|nr:DUF3667 domain-containing protein [Flavobacterium succinicans]SFN57448.1 Protein of unknown function [Flavobacterium succinicans]
MNCKNCNTEINSKFCPDCGQPTDLKRIDGHYIIHEIEHVLHFERGILYTVRGLVTKPGQNIRNYLSENRSRLVKPIIFIIVTSLIYTLISHFFHIEEEYVNYKGLEKSSIGTILKWIQGNYGYASILTGIFIAIWLKVFFRKYGYNFFELLIMLCFVQGISMLIFAVFAFAQGLLHFKLLKVAGIIGVIYVIWAIGNFFEAKRIGNYFKALISFLLGTITFYIIIFAIGITIDVLTKN